MPTFTELKKKSHVSAHPLFQSWDERVAKMRAAMKHRTATDIDLLDIFSKVKQVGLKPGDRSLNAFIQEAAIAAQAALDVLHWPLPPKVSYNNVKNVRHARHDEDQIIDAEVLFNLRICTVTGVTRQALLPVTIHDGAVVPPSTIVFEDRMYVLGQNTVDSIVNRNTSFYLEPLRGEYSPPLRGDELDIAVEQRNSRGWQPREFSGQNLLTRSLAKRAFESPEEAKEWLEKGLSEGERERIREWERQREPGESYEEWEARYEGRPPRSEAHRQAQDFNERDWNVPGSPMKENKDTLLEQENHDPRDLDSDYKRETPGEKSRKKDRDRQQDNADKQKREKEQKEHSGKDSSRHDAQWWEQVQQFFSDPFGDELPTGTSPSVHLETGQEGYWGGFINSATQQVYNAIVSDPAYWNIASRLASQSLNVQTFARQLESEPTFQTAIPQEDVSEVGEVDWTHIANALLSAGAPVEEGVVAPGETPEEEVAPEPEVTAKAAQATSPAIPSAMGDPGIATDPTVVAPSYPGQSTPQYQSSGDPTGDLYVQITRQPQIMEMVKFAMQEPYVEDQVSVIYDAVLPLTQSIGVDPNQIDWYGLTEDLVAYVGFGVEEVAAKRVAKIIGKYLMKAKKAQAEGWEELLDVGDTTRELFDDILLDQKKHSEMMDLVQSTQDIDLPEALQAAFGAVSGPEYYVDWDFLAELAEEHAFGREGKMKNAQNEGDAKPGAVEDIELQRFTPPGYDVVLGDMVEAEEQGLDSFPREYAHVEQNYILRRLHTCSKDHWFPHLLNDGFVLNPYGPNRGRPGNPDAQQKAKKK